MTKTTKNGIREKIEKLEKEIKELKELLNDERENIEWITIDYSVIDKKVFDKYGVKPFQIMKKKMRNENGKVWNFISFDEAKKEAEKRGWRLPKIQEIFVLLDEYKRRKGDDVNVCDEEFLGIEELSYDEDVCYEFVDEYVFVDRPVVFLRGGVWSIGSNAGVFTLGLAWSTGVQDNYVGFRCVRDLIKSKKELKSKLK